MLWITFNISIQKLKFHIGKLILKDMKQECSKVFSLFASFSCCRFVLFFLPSVWSYLVYSCLFGCSSVFSRAFYCFLFLTFFSKGSQKFFSYFQPQTIGFEVLGKSFTRTEVLSFFLLNRCLVLLVFGFSFWPKLFFWSVLFFLHFSFYFLFLMFLVSCR